MKDGWISIYFFPLYGTRWTIRDISNQEDSNEIWNKEKWEKEYIDGFQVPLNDFGITNVGGTFGMNKITFIYFVRFTMDSYSVTLLKTTNNYENAMNYSANQFIAYNHIGPYVMIKGQKQRLYSP